MYESPEEGLSQNHNHHHHHHHHHHQQNNNNNNVHYREQSRNSRNNSSKMACEKANRRLNATLAKASRFGLTSTDLASLPSVKRIISHRDHDWKLGVLMLFTFAAGVILALLCTSNNKSCSTRIEDIVSLF